MAFWIKAAQSGDKHTGRNTALMCSFCSHFHCWVVKPFTKFLSPHAALKVLWNFWLEAASSDCYHENKRNKWLPDWNGHQKTLTPIAAICIHFRHVLFSRVSLLLILLHIESFRGRTVPGYTSSTASKHIFSPDRIMEWNWKGLHNSWKPLKMFEKFKRCVNHFTITLIITCNSYTNNSTHTLFHQNNFVHYASWETHLVETLKFKFSHGILNWLHKKDLLIYPRHIPALEDCFL